MPCSLRLGSLDCEFARHSKDLSIASFALEAERLEGTKVRDVVCRSPLSPSMRIDGKAPACWPQ